MPDTPPARNTAARGGLAPLQSLIRPDAALPADPALYARLSGAASFDARDGARGGLRLGPGARARFDTYFNLFNTGKWMRHCALDDLSLALTGTGTVTVSVHALRPDMPEESLISARMTLSEDPTLLTLPAPLPDPGIVFFEITADDGPARLEAATWSTTQAPRRVPDMALVITTFRRETAVRKTVDRFRAFMTRTPLAGHLHLLVIDNGQSAGITTDACVTAIDNANLGGSGGFARGLIEARARGATHCLFMDDDAAIHMQSLERTWAFLAHATDPVTAVAGALSTAACRWEVWENGARFDRRCWQLHTGTDLRDADAVARMEWDTTGPPPHGFYGGWWYFAFPVAAARHMPFPFFVRGDDISFSLVNGFSITTLPGVMSYQDADFADKESALTLYLDLRSHLAHHLALPAMEIGRWRCLRIAAWFFVRSLVKHHHETLAALNLSFADLMAGPDFFAANADMARRRAEIAALRDIETWAAVTAPLPADRVRIDTTRALPRLAMKLTLNGYLLPFFGRFGNRVTLRMNQPGGIRNAWGAAEITYLSADGREAYTVRASKPAAWAQIARFSGLALRFVLRYRRIRDSWRAGYGDLASERFWRGALGLPKEGAP